MKNKNKLTCKTGGLKKNIIKKEVFEREIALCQMLFKKHKGKCGWGICKNCGVVPFLYKLYKGKLIDNPDELTKIKKKVFKIRPKLKK